MFPTVNYYLMFYLLSFFLINGRIFPCVPIAAYHGFQYHFSYPQTPQITVSFSISLWRHSSQSPLLSCSPWSGYSLFLLHSCCAGTSPCYHLRISLHLLPVWISCFLKALSSSFLVYTLFWSVHPLIVSWKSG